MHAGLRTWLCAAFTLLVPASSAVAAELDQQRAQFSAAVAQLEEASDATPADTELLQRYAIYPYLQYLRLKAQLKSEPEAADPRIAEFLAQQGEQPVAWRMRNRWLRSLAKRERWAQLLAAAPAKFSDDLLNCHRLRARLETQDLRGLVAEALAQWTQASDQPSACDPVFTWLKDMGQFSDARVAKRLELTLAAERGGLSRYLLGLLSAKAQRQYQPRVELLRDPAGSLQRWLRKPSTGIAADELVAAHWRLARRDPRSAEKLLQPLRDSEYFNLQQQAELQRNSALGLAYDRQADALELFASLPDSALDEHAYEWRIRVAVLAGDWRRVAAWTAELPEAERDSARWQYWAGRAAAELGDAQAAQRHYSAAAGEREYYGFLAAERLGLALDPQHQELAEDAAIQQALLAEPGLIKARELHHAGQLVFALSEWNHALQDMGGEAITQAAILAARWGWHEQAIVRLAQQERWDDIHLRFALPYPAAVAAASRISGLDQLWIYTVMRAESLYHPQARSGAGAYGLMQLLPSTARQVARELGLPRPSRKDLYQPSVNLPLGAGYLKDLYEDLQSWPLVFAAYNAGPHRVARWRLEREVPADVWIANVPYNETRGYIQRALMNVVIFGWRMNGEPTPLTPLLLPVAPK